MKKKGFTLIELLVVIAIIAMLLAILMPALNKVKQLAQRLVCATNLKGMGTALMVYSNDDKYDQYPNLANSSTTWAYLTANWVRNPADPWPPATQTIGASLFLLVREADVDPKSFVCKSSDQRAYDKIPPDYDLVELGDFGSCTWDDKTTGPQNCVSYAYQVPFSLSGLTARPANSSASSSMALMADRNPYFDNAGVRGDATDTTYMGIADQLRLGTATEYSDIVKWRIQAANSFAHNREGQNVLFNDGHAEFMKRPDIGVANDNIYICYSSVPPATPTEDQKRAGAPKGATMSNSPPRDTSDTYLANDVLEDYDFSSSG
ncbi:MAG: type II secretion system protein [Planctomycetes bacterium]|nr:type II secretion system protein [Planctomycetota bacterium]